MKVSEAVAARISARAFLPDPVPDEVIRRVLERASRAPSGGNLQPWIVSVLNGPKLDEFRAIAAQRLAETDGQGEGFEYKVYPDNLHEPYRTRRFGVGEMMYAKLGIERADKAGRLAWFANNYRFFGAPAAFFIHVDRRMNAPQWSDLGMFLQTVMLLFQEEGYDTCAQEAWARLHETIDAFTGASEETMVFCGLAIGKIDRTHPVNTMYSERAPLDEWVKFL
ncbi:Nitroreductase [Albimonas donghaensis]|uniref:Nitroreductase n=1 Tax=Albimonas donghaensis TaxID=356660 RepID=A0A1H2YSW7_9RHOB|nr:nitroreductase [Albimonas donghaensis]SDX07659.1 Nitroreductase [Albimonas donghaensis]